MIRERQLAPAKTAAAPTPEAQIQQKLDALFPPGESRRWLDTCQDQLGSSPREMIDQGQAERVLRILIRLEQGIPT